MDELEALETLSGPRHTREPGPDVVDRHRQELRAAVQAEGAATLTTGGDDLSGPADGRVVELHRPARAGGVRWLPTRAVAAAAAVVLLAAGAVALSERGAGDTDETVAATGPASGDPSTRASGDGASTLTCGDDLPIDVAVPDGFAGPSTGPGGDAPRGPGPGQLVLHWASPTGIVEVRWPADPDGVGSRDDVRDRGPDGYAGEPGNVVTSHDVARPTSTGRVAQEVVAWVSGTSAGCEATGLIISGPDAAAVAATNEQVTNHVFDRYLPPLVTASSTVDSAPEVGRCRAPAGIAAPPNRGGSVTGFGVHPTAAAALQAFVETQGTPGSPVPEPTLIRRGYQEMTLPDRSIAYAYESTPDFFTTVIHVVEADEGWTVAEWEASGC